MTGMEVVPLLETLSLESLNAYIGNDWGSWGQQVDITQERVNAFADITGDHQFIHVDPSRAKAAGHSGTIAHGALLLSLLACMRAPQFRVAEGISVKNVEGKYCFKRPVAVGETVHTRERMIKVQQIRGSFEAISQYEIHILGGNPRPQ
jgi:acyl dehydratase